MVDDGAGFTSGGTTDENQMSSVDEDGAVVDDSVFMLGGFVAADNVAISGEIGALGATSGLSLTEAVTGNSLVVAFTSSVARKSGIFSARLREDSPLDGHLKSMILRTRGSSTPISQAPLVSTNTV